MRYNREYWLTIEELSEFLRDAKEESLEPKMEVILKYEARDLVLRISYENEYEEDMVERLTKLGSY